MTRNSIVYRRPIPRLRKGFTLIELLVAIAIIVVLIGMFFVSFKYVKNAGARSSTKVAMDNLKGMLGEFESASHFNRVPPMWSWYQAGGGTWSASAGSFGTSGATADFWRYPYSKSNSSATTVTWEPLDSPGDVSWDNGPVAENQRSCAEAVINTQIAMQGLAGVAANKAAVDKLPTGARYVLPFRPMGTTVASALSATSPGWLNDDGSDSSGPFQYPQGVHVTYGGNFYTSVVATQTTPTASMQTPWYDETAAPRGVPVVLDGWNNPIIFVPASGLKVRLLNGQSAYDKTKPTELYVIVSPEGVVTGNGTATPVVTKTGRPFFASAGPDGDFTKGDDNVYSFEN